MFEPPERRATPFELTVIIVGIGILMILGGLSSVIGSYYWIESNESAALDYRKLGIVFIAAGIVTLVLWWVFKRIID